ncbi:MAG: hypothetical protein ACXABO_13545 [Promethearchaeota archaeon]|jgi:tRNA nucleotidyltransferase (CCA-adding enzyme)
MSLINDILSDVLKDVTPSKEEITRIESITEKLKKLLDIKAKELSIDYIKIEPQGSTGIKQTQLKNDFDIDLFIGLNYENYKPKYNGLSKNKLKKVSKKDFLGLCNNWIIPSLSLKEFRYPRLLYAEHPYVTVDHSLNNIEIKIDIVLYFDIELQIIKEHGPITAVDRSPWHGRFIRDNLSEDQRNYVRLIKQFFKSNHSYGDKSSLGKVGFIGYSAELLIYYFGTIQNLFKNFHTLDKNPLDFYKRDLKEIKKITHFQNDYLIIIDPIDKNRNVASAISEQAYKYCNQRITEFLKKPSKEFFLIKPLLEIDPKNLKNSLKSKIYIVELKNVDKDRHYTIIRDKLHSLGKSLKANGETEFTHAERFKKVIFEIYFEDEIHEYNIAIYCEKPDISQSYIRKGPPVNDAFHSNKFKKRNVDHFEKNGYLWVKTTRKFHNFLDFLKSFIKTNIPTRMEILNISKANNTKTISGRKALTLLINMVLPLYS